MSQKTNLNPTKLHDLIEALEISHLDYYQAYFQCLKKCSSEQYVREIHHLTTLNCEMQEAKLKLEQYVANTIHECNSKK